MTYVMSKRMYKEFTTGKASISHKQLIEHINNTFGLRGQVVDVKVSK
ncbi:hypothetical protein [Bacillus sp. 1P02SD]